METIMLLEGIVFAVIAVICFLIAVTESSENLGFKIETENCRIEININTNAFWAPMKLFVAFATICFINILALWLVSL